MTSYTKIFLGNENRDFIFVRTKDFIKFKRARRGKDAKKTVSLLMKLLLGSPDGFNMVYEGMEVVHRIYAIKSLKQLEALKQIIEDRIISLTKPKRKKNAKKIK